MFVKSTADCPPFTAVDGCRIREVLRPAPGAPVLPYSLAHAEVRAGARTYRHRLQHDEVYYLLAGVGTMHVDSAVRRITAGDAVHIPAGAVQWIENEGAETLVFIALVSPPWQADADERLEP